METISRYWCLTRVENIDIQIKKKGNMKIKLSQSDWKKIGVKTGWLKEAYTKRLDMPGETPVDAGGKPNSFDEKFHGGLSPDEQSIVRDLDKMIGKLRKDLAGMPEGGSSASRIQEKIEKYMANKEKIMAQARKRMEMKGGGEDSAAKWEKDWEKGNEEGLLRGLGIYP